MDLIGKVRLGWREAYELQIFMKEQAWLRLTRDPQRNSLGFWSRKGDGGLAEWERVALELDGLLLNVPVDDRPAIDRACTYWPDGWEFWGPGVPAPIHYEVTSGAIERASLVGKRLELPR